MWLIFIIAVIATAFVALIVVRIGASIFMSIKRENRKYDMETEIFERETGGKKN